MIAPRAPSPTGLELAQPLAVRLFKEPGGPLLARIPVRPADFAEAASEGWRDGCLRAGHPHVPLAEAPMRLFPVLAEGSDSHCAGFRLEVTPSGGKPAHCLYTLRCLEPVADRAMAPLVEAGALKPGDSCHFEVVVDARGAGADRPPADGIELTVSLRHTALAYLKVSLGPLLARARPMAVKDDAAPPVFYTEEAFAKAEACARRGATANVESGGALFGSLAACPESGEFFSIVHDVIEVQEADEARLSLAYTSRSWLRLQQIQQARQAAYPERAERLLGQTHGHPFRPNDGKACADCEKRATCALTSAWTSREDQTWHRSVFARQPWALCHIFGLTARGEPAHQLFGLKDGRLQARGFYLLPDFPFD